MYQGKDTIIVLPQFQIDGMVEVMDYLLTHLNVRVEDVKKQFNLNEEEYHMIYEFCMPHNRHRANETYWIHRYKSIYAGLEELILMAKKNHDKTIPIEAIKNIQKRYGIGAQNKNCHETINGYEPDEEFDDWRVEDEGLF